MGARSSKTRAKIFAAFSQPPATRQNSADFFWDLVKITAHLGLRKNPTLRKNPGLRQNRGLGKIKCRRTFAALFGDFCAWLSLQKLAAQMATLARKWLYYVNATPNLPILYFVWLYCVN